MFSFSHISKEFGGFRALLDVDLEVVPGEIHALVGENGAGKSTLVKIIAGAIAPSSGAMSYGGKALHFKSPAESKAAGIHVIHQEFVLFPHLTVAENIFIGNERRNRFGLLDRRRAEREAYALLESLGIELHPDELVANLTIADQQLVEIAKVLAHDVKLLILDEPTAVISGREVDLLFDRLRQLRARGVAILYISHRLDEIFALCDTVTVLKDGQRVGTTKVTEVDRDQLVSMMVGRDLTSFFPPKRKRSGPAEIVLHAEDVVVPGKVRTASITLRAGEITGLAGMVGSGRSEFAMAMFGAIPMSTGRITIRGKTHRAMSPATAIAEGMGFLTEDRKNQGLAMLLDVAANISAPALKQFSSRGLLDHEKEGAVAIEEIAAYRIACRGPKTLVAHMSGGNQQKVLLARWARTCRSVLILDEPTRGVDVGAKYEIYKIIQSLATRGLAILMISSELPEIVGMCDRVAVMREGAIAGELSDVEITEESIMHLASRKTAEEPAA